MSDADIIITLVSSDSQDHKLFQREAVLSTTVKNLIEDAGVDNPIPLPNITGRILGKVVEFCKYHTEHPFTPRPEGEEPKTDDICQWDQDFFRVDQETLFALLTAANYMEISTMLEVACKTVANMLKGRTPEDIRAMFGITEPFTEEEMEQIRKENEWCNETVTKE